MAVAAGNAENALNFHAGRGALVASSGTECERERVDVAIHPPFTLGAIGSEGALLERQGVDAAKDASTRFITVFGVIAWVDGTRGPIAGVCDGHVWHTTHAREQETDPDQDDVLAHPIITAWR
jgi:hypothetical protein